MLHKLGPFTKKKLDCSCIFVKKNAFLQRKTGNTSIYFDENEKSKQFIGYGLIQLTVVLIRSLVVNLADLCAPQTIVSPFNAIILQVLAFRMDFPYW